jgi:phenylpyruvate tautomerase PptA (4-oxalocrotonate tautomerase family)
MPYVNIKITKEGATPEQNNNLLRVPQNYFQRF